MTRAWKLLADIGATNARFAACPGGERGDDSEWMPFTSAVADHAEFAGALDAFLDRLAARGGWHARPQAACIALAAPISGDRARMINAPWELDRRAIAGHLGLEEVFLINDFEAIGHAVPALSPSDSEALDEASPDERAPCIVLGAGSGLGLCLVVPTRSGQKVVAAEGGHVDLPARTADERSLYAALEQRFGHVSAERVLSGPGLVYSYAHLAALDLTQAPSAAAITTAALTGTDETARRCVEMFCAFLGNVAANAALTTGARGGVYIAGGIAPRLLPVLREGHYRRRFLDKGRYRNYLVGIPTRVITHPAPGLLGADAFLRANA
jgi:glucokinase